MNCVIKMFLKCERSSCKMTSCNLCYEKPMIYRAARPRWKACVEGIGVVNGLNVTRCYSMSLASAVRMLIPPWLLTWPSERPRRIRAAAVVGALVADPLNPSASRKASFARIRQLTFEEFHEAFGETKAACHGDRRGGDGHSCAACPGDRARTHACTRACVFHIAESVLSLERRGTFVSAVSNSL